MFDKILLAVLVSIVAVQVSIVAHDHFEVVKQREASEAYKVEAHKKRVVACETGVTTDIMYAGKFCKVN